MYPIRKEQMHRMPLDSSSLTTISAAKMLVCDLHWSRFQRLAELGAGSLTMGTIDLDTKSRASTIVVLFNIVYSLRHQHMILVGNPHKIYPEES
jgi:hypothetical protein